MRLVRQACVVVVATMVIQAPMKVRAADKGDGSEALQSRLSCDGLLNVAKQRKAQLFPFDRHSREDVATLRQRILEGLELAKGRIQKIEAQTAKPTFENTVIAYEDSGPELEEAFTALWIYESHVGSPELSKLMQEVSPLAEDFQAAIFQNERLFRRFADLQQAVKDEQLKISGEDRERLNKILLAFEENGLHLPPDKRERFRNINRRLAELGSIFSERLKTSKSKISLPLSDPSLLKGVPEYLQNQAAELARRTGQTGFVFSYGMLGLLLEYADNPDVRERAFFLMRSAALRGENDNRPIVVEIAELRRELAILMGDDNYSSRVLKSLMAGGADKVNDFLDAIADKARPGAEQEFAELAKLKAEVDGNDVLKPWDVAYFSRLMDQRKFQFDGENLRPYFEISRVQKGFFEVAKALYGVRFVRAQGIPVWHEDVEVFEVQEEDGRLVGHIFMDFWERKGQKDGEGGGAWSAPILKQWTDPSTDWRPSILISMNLKRTPGEPTLLLPDEVETYFHEMGHAMHGLLSQVKYQAFAGTSVVRDFVELPSQLMERFLLRREVLDMFAAHNETGQQIPEELFQALVKARSAPQGAMFLARVRQSKLDLLWHSRPLPSGMTVDEFDRLAVDPYLFVRLPGGYHIPSTQAFSHIWDGGYASKYYSYLWSEMLDADAFEFMSENGLLTRQIGERLRRMLEQGGSRPAMEIYEEFRGRQPRADALNRRIMGSL